MAGVEALVGNDAALWVNTELPDPATLDVGTGAAGVTYTAKRRGTAGNSIRVAHVAAAGANADTTVAVSGNDITVTLGTGGVAGTEDATADEVVAAVNADPDAKVLVSAAPLGDGSGVAVEQALTALSGGAVAGAPNYQLVGLQRGLTHELTREMIDASHKGSDFMKSVYGRQSGTITMDALEPDPDFGGAQATHDALTYAMNYKDTILVEIRKNGSAGTVKRDAAEALVGTMTSEYPDNDVSTVALELTLQEPFTPVA
jgi:hypothetical protein